MSDDDISEAAKAAATPSDAEIVAAKTAILSLLSDGQIHGHRELIACSAAANGLANPDAGHRATPIDASSLPLDRDHPVLTWNRLLAADWLALNELEADGTVLPLREHGPEGRSPSISWQRGNRSGSAQWQLDVAPLSGAFYQLRRELRLQPSILGLEPDLMVADLASLQLDPRTERSLREAVSAARHGGYLAAASLLGAAVEGAWYAAAEQMRGAAPALDKALDDDATQRLQRLVADQIRSVRGQPNALPDELLSHASLMRALRNYGVHPRGDTSGLERYFSEAGARLILLTTHHHLTALAAAIAAFVAARATP